MKTAVIYARFSSSSQTEQSIEGQLRVCNEYASRNDITIMDTYIDRATTDTNDNRFAFQKMLRDSDKKAWDIVLVYKLDRFSRNKYELATHKRHLRDNNIKLVSEMENIPDTPEGIILESLLEGMAEYYSAELSQKVKRGLNESRIKGNFTGGHMPHGYKVENKKLVLDEERAPIVRFIYEQSAACVDAKDIIAKLHEQGVMYNGRLIARNTVYNILKNQKYSGNYTVDGKLYEDLYPRIVSPEIYNIVRSRIDRNKYGKHSIEVKYLLRDKLFCGYCGSTICAEAGTYHVGTIKRYYKCLAKKRGSKCKLSITRKNILEDFVVNIIYETLGKSNILETLVDKILDFHKNKNKNHSLLGLLQGELSDIEKQIDNFMKAISMGIITASIKQKLDELELQKIDLENKIVIENSKIAIELKREDIREYFKEALLKEPLQMIDLLINKIVLYNDKIEVYFKFTQKESPDDNSQGSLLYHYKNTIPMPITNKKEYGKKDMKVMILF